jgi:hypothetical protein
VTPHCHLASTFLIISECDTSHPCSRVCQTTAPGVRVRVAVGGSRGTRGSVGLGGREQEGDELQIPGSAKTAVLSGASPTSAPPPRRARASLAPGTRARVGMEEDPAYDTHGRESWAADRPKPR